MGSATYDLHGCEQLVFSDWSEEPSYFERVTITDQAEARKFLAGQIAIDAEDLDPQPIFMRWEAAPPDKPFKFEGYEYDGGWLECDEDHPDAVPFWKDAP